MSGYCSVDTHVVFVVKFQPFEQKNIIEGEVSSRSHFLAYRYAKQSLNEIP